MSTWTEQLTANSVPAAVLDVLPATDPGACGRWAPVAFEVRRLDGERRRAGSRARVAGRLAGRELGFEVEVIAADQERLALLASWPIDLDVEYRLRTVPTGSELSASIAVRGKGVAGRVLARATDALLSAGALRHAMTGIGREAECAVAL